MANKIMTEEEAIEMLKKDKEQRGNCLISDAVDMGIDSLKKEPKMLAEIAHLRKYISKLETQIVGQEPVLDKIKGYINHIRNTGLGKKKSLEFIEKYIDGLKAEREQFKGDAKIGKWTPGDPICPCCGEDKFKDLDADIWSDWRPKYCPNCGARMESE